MLSDINFTRSFVIWHRQYGNQIYQDSLGSYLRRSNGFCSLCNGSRRKSFPGEPPTYCYCGLLETLPQRVALLDSYRSEFIPAEKGTFKTQGNKTLELALDATRAFAVDPKRWVILGGRRGTGKTHLARLVATHFGPACLFITMQDLAMHVSAAIRTNELDILVHRIRTAPILVLDELGGDYEGFKIAINMLQNIVSFRDARPEQFPVFGTTNLTKEKLVELGDYGRTFSRLCSKEHSDWIGINNAKDWRTE